MTAKRVVRSAAVVLGAVTLWGVPISGAQARYHHNDPPREASAQSQDGSGPRSQESRPQQASSEPNSATADGCFRQYYDRCQRARENYRGHRDEPAY